MIEGKDNPFQKGTKKGKHITSTTFKKGKPGGPGRPKGLRNKSTILIETIGQNRVDYAYHKMAEMCVTGDKEGCFNACKFIIERSLPPENGRKVFLGKRSTSSAEAIADTAEKVMSMMFEGDLSLEESESIGKMLDQRLKTLFETSVVQKAEETCKRADEIMG